MFNKNYFICQQCGKRVDFKAFGTLNRNHCNFCLWSRHVDEKIGDRKSKCKGLMEPVDLAFKKDGELMIVHKCDLCRKISTNRIAGDDSVREIIKIAEKSKTLNKKNKIDLNVLLFGKV